MVLGLKSIVLKLSPRRVVSRKKRQTKDSNISQSEENLDLSPRDASALSAIPDFSTSQYNLNSSVGAQQTVKFADAPEHDPWEDELWQQIEDPLNLFRFRRPIRPNRPPNLFIETSSGTVPFLSFDDRPTLPTSSDSTDEGDYGPDRLFGDRKTALPRLPSGEGTANRKNLSKKRSCREPVLKGRQNNNTASGIPNTLGTFYCLQVRTTGLLQSFCILDAQLPGKPICVASKDMIPSGPFAENEALFIEGDLGDEAMRIESTERNGVVANHLLLKHELVPIGSAETSHEVISQIDITNLTLKCTDEDLWLQIATEEMKRLATWNKVLLSHLPVLPSPFEDLPTDVQQNINYIQAFNSFSFIISQSTKDSSSYELTHVSKHWPTASDDFIPGIVQGFNEGLPKLGKHLSKGERFFFDIRSDLSTKQELVCCVPMFGPMLSCWLCFLISGPAFESCLPMGDRM